MRSRRASCPAGCAARTTTRAAATPTPAARSSCRGTAARPRCRRGSSSITTSPTPTRIPRPDRDVELTRLHRATAPRTPRPELFLFAFDHRDPFFELARATGADERRIPALKQLFVGRWRRRKRRAGSTVASACCATIATGRMRSTPRPGRGWWIGRPVELPGLESRRVRARPLDRHDAHRMAGRACREVPRAVPSRRRGRQPPRERGAGAGALRCRAGERSRAADRDRAAEASAGRSRTSCCAR